MKTVRELLRDRRFSLGAGVLLVLAVLALLSFFSPYPQLDSLFEANELGSTMKVRKT